MNTLLGFGKLAVLLAAGGLWLLSLFLRGRQKRQFDRERENLLAENRNLRRVSANANSLSPGEEDHSFFLKLAGELTRIEKNLSRMDCSGIKQIQDSINRLKDTLQSRGYEILTFLGKEYHQGMKVEATFRPAPELAPGRQVITRVIVPQVNYNGVMIQAAKIEVSQGE